MFKYVWHHCKRNSLRVGRVSSAQSFQILRARCLCIHTHAHTYTHTLPLSKSCISFLSKAVDALVFRPLFQRVRRETTAAQILLCVLQTEGRSADSDLWRDSRKKERDGGREWEKERLLNACYLYLCSAHRRFWDCSFAVFSDKELYCLGYILHIQETLSRREVQL